MKEQYLDALNIEIDNLYKKELLKTIYFGGGTPSNLSAKEFSTILEKFNFDQNSEITVELNPETINLKYLQDLKAIGINRLSFGCQTFDNKILKDIGRRHLSEDVINSVNYAKQAGFKNISLDFIYGLPTQTTENFVKDLNTAISLDIEHISLYGLKIENGCFFYKNPPANLPNDDIQAEMYLKAIEILGKNGFEHYEISNFAKKGFHSRHNLNYWENNNYYGFGVAAHGYENGTRYFNTSNLQEYIENPIPYKDSHKLTIQEQLEEEIFLGFRKIAGINIEQINKKFNIDFSTKYKKIIDKYTNYNYLEPTDTGYKLTDSGILISNYILSDFLQ